MGDWREMSRESLAAAQHCLREKCYRSSVSRAYYAAYAALAAALAQRGMEFTLGREGPSHQALRQYVNQNIGAIKNRNRKRIVAAINQLYQNRIDADYKPARYVGHDTALISLRNASFVAASVRI